MKTANFLDGKSKVMMKLPVRLLNVDETYQKPLSNAQVKKIVENFNPMGVGQIHVSKRSDGSFWIFDGQHRTMAYRTKGIKEIECIVYEGLSLVEESLGYTFYNTILAQNPLDKAKNELFQGEPSMVAIDAVVKSLGLEIDYLRTNGNHTLQAIGAIKTIYNQGGVSDLKEVLRIMKEALGTHKKNFQGIVIQGLHLFITEYTGLYDDKWLISRIRKSGLDDLMMKANGFRSVHGCDKKTAIKYALVACYNFNKNKEHKL